MGDEDLNAVCTGASEHGNSGVSSCQKMQERAPLVETVVNDHTFDGTSLAERDHVLSFPQAILRRIVK